jgi:hypothetical protein
MKCSSAGTATRIDAAVTAVATTDIVSTATNTHITTVIGATNINHTTVGRTTDIINTAISSTTDIVNAAVNSLTTIIVISATRPAATSTTGSQGRYHHQCKYSKNHWRALFK